MTASIPAQFTRLTPPAAAATSPQTAAAVESFRNVVAAGNCGRHRDEPSHRVSDHVRAAHASRVHHRQRIGRHVLDAERVRAERARADSPVVKRHQAMRVLQAIELRSPAFATHAHTLDQQHGGGLRGAHRFIAQAHSVRFNKWHASIVAPPTSRVQID